MAMTRGRAVLGVAVAATSCSPTQPELPAVRFANAPAVTVVNDRRPVPHRPSVTRPMLELDYYDRSFLEPMRRAMSLPVRQRARGVNALDEVPDSTWFTNRIGVRDMTPDEVARGPGLDEGPEPHKPWTVLGTKPGGTELGFLITDARGVKYGLTFDAPHWPELETGTGAVVNRLLWAAGYNVPDDRVAYVRPEELVVASAAMVKDRSGRVAYRLDRKELDAKLANAWHTPDGQIRVLASRWLDGESLGGTPPTGVREGDPNDVIPHQDRRDLRGQYALFAWVDHVDLIRGNFADMFVTSRRDPSRRYVMHYMVDFGKSLAVIGLTDRYVRVGFEYLFDWSTLGSPILGFGISPRPWGRHWAPDLIGVSPLFTAKGFDPGTWRPAIQYAPFDAADRIDMFWGAKLVGRFTREQIRAAVEAGRFSDPATVEYLTNTLVARQHATLAHWYTRVNPLDRFVMTDNGLCFDDLAIWARLARAAKTRYDLTSFDRDARLVGRKAIGAAPTGQTCTGPLNVSTSGDGYTIVKIQTSRPDWTASTLVHLARAPVSGRWHVIGVWRI